MLIYIPLKAAHLSDDLGLYKLEQALFGSKVTFTYKGIQGSGKRWSLRALGPSCASSEVWAELRGLWVVGRGSWVMGHGSQVLGHGASSGPRTCWFWYSRAAAYCCSRWAMVKEAALAKDSPEGGRRERRLITALPCALDLSYFASLVLHFLPYKTRVIPGTCFVKTLWKRISVQRT